VNPEGPHPESHEALLRAVVTGDLAADDPQVLRLQEECAQCRSTLEGVLYVAEELEQDARRESAALANAEPGPPLDIENLILQEARGRGPLRRISPWWLAAAAAVAVIAIVLNLGPERRPAPPVDPSLGPTAPGARFEWSADGSLSLYFDTIRPQDTTTLTVTILNEGSGHSVEAVQSREPEKPRWVLSAEQAAKLAKRVQVIVEEFDTSDKLIGNTRFELEIPAR
jgi:hypothetical protein